MHILIAGNYLLPATTYGGTERVMWWLGKALVDAGHRVTYLAAAGSTCPFAQVRYYDSRLPLAAQIPDDVDIVHANDPVLSELPTPFLVTIHANIRTDQALDRNSVFISRNHAERFGADTYVYHGLDFEEYGTPDFDRRRDYVHFLAKAAWKRKNVKGAIEIARQAGTRLAVLGGYRLNFKMGFRLTLDRHVSFHGMVGGAGKNALINGSRALLFPVLWHEPFGLAVIESLYFGCPAYTTRYGSLPELVSNEVGFTSNSISELVDAVTDIRPGARLCHEYVRDRFSSRKMAENYIRLYERVLTGSCLNAAPPMAPRNEPKYLPMLP